MRAILSEVRRKNQRYSCARVRNHTKTALYNFEGRLRRYITEAEAADVIGRNKAEWRCGRCGQHSEKGRCLGSESHKLSLYLLEPENISRRSPCTLTSGDMQANVGIAGDPGLPPAKKRVAAARAKVDVWMEVFDTKAPCVEWLQFAGGKPPEMVLA